MKKILVMSKSESVYNRLRMLYPEDNLSYEPSYKKILADGSLKFDAAVLDLDTHHKHNRPYLVCEHLNKLKINVLAISYKCHLRDKFTSLNYGAYDYLCKPFSDKEFKKRVDESLEDEE